MTIFDRVFEIAKQKKITQTDIAEACNVRQSTVSDWKRGRCVPSAEKIGDLAILLGVTTDYLILGIAPAASVQQGIFGDDNKNNTVAINSNGAMSEIESELLRICGKLDVRRKNLLLTRAYELESEIDGGNV